MIGVIDNKLTAVRQELVSHKAEIMVKFSDLTTLIFEFYTAVKHCFVGNSTRGRLDVLLDKASELN